MFKRSAIRRAKKKLAEDAMTCKPTEHDYKKLKICKIDHRSLENRCKLLEDQLAKATDLKQEVEKRAEALRREVDILT
jgi:hypothetical protein